MARTTRKIHDRMVDFGAAPAAILGVLLIVLGGLSHNYAVSTIGSVLMVLGVFVAIIATLVWAKNTPEEQ